MLQNMDSWDLLSYSQNIFGNFLSDFSLKSLNNWVDLLMANQVCFVGVHLVIRSISRFFPYHIHLNTPQHSCTPTKQTLSRKELSKDNGFLITELKRLIIVISHLFRFICYQIINQCLEKEWYYSKYILSLFS